MKLLMLALAAAGLALAVSGCGGGGAESAGPVPSVPVAAVAPATSPGNDAEEHLPTAVASPSAAGRTWNPDAIVEYVAQADAICQAASEKLEAALTELHDTDQSAAEVAKQGLAYDIAEDAIAQLRALPPPDVPAVTPVALCSHRSGSQESDSGPTRVEYIAQANEICQAANRSFDSKNFPLRGLHEPRIAEARARIEEEALAQLRALPQPEADRALLEEGFYQVVEQEIYAHRGQAAAARAGDEARKYLLGMERVHLTHQRGEFTEWYGLAGSCPLSLPA